MKVYFAWKQLKVDIIHKIFEKKEIAGTVLFVSWLAKYQWNKIFENGNSVGAGAHEGGRVASFWFNFDPHFYWYFESVKRVNYIYIDIGWS